MDPSTAVTTLKPAGHTEVFTIHINKKLFKVHVPEMTGAELKKLGGIPPENQLMEERTGGEKDLPIGDADRVQMRNGLHFYDVAPGTFGRADSGVEVKVNGERVLLEDAKMAGKELRQLIGANGTGQLFRDVAGELVPVCDEEVIEVSAGDQFLMVAPAVFGFGFTEGSPANEEVERLREHHQVELLDLGGGDVGVKLQLGLPPGWNRRETVALIRVPRAYPHAQLDTFCTEQELRLADGRMPTNASPANVAGRMWLQFSWHPRSWRPGIDNLLRYVGFVKGRLNEVR
jgi:hypothetical protein